MQGLIVKGKKPVAQPVLGIPVTHEMVKALNTGKLVQKKIQVTNKSGKTFQVNKWVRIDKNKKTRIRAEEPIKTTKNQKPKEDDIKIGQKISYTIDGEKYSGKVTQTGFHDGVIAKDSNGKEYPVEWKNIDGRDKKGGGGDDGNGSDKNLFSKTDEIRKLFNLKAIVEGWRDGTKGLQPFNTVKDMYEKCEADRKPFLNYSNAVKKIFSSIDPKLITRPELKRLDRIQEKLREDDRGTGKCYDKETDTYNPETIRDVDGHTFCVNSITEVEKLLDYFDTDKNIIRIKNNFAKPSEVGYSDINMNIRLPGGTISEIQVNTTANIVAKEKYGHSLYEVWRAIHLKPEYKELSDLMAEGQKKLYGLSNKYSKEGTFPDVGENNPFFQVEHEPYADAIRNFVTQAKSHYEKAKKEGVLDKDTIKHFDHLVDFIGA